MADEKLLWQTIRKFFQFFLSLFQNIKVRSAPSGVGLAMTSYPVGIKTSLSRKPCIADKKLLLNTFIKSWSLSNVYKNSANIIFKTVIVNGRVSRSHKTANVFFHLTQ